MMAYQNKKDEGFVSVERRVQRQGISVGALVELASRAKALDEEWVWRCLFALNEMDNADLADAVLARLRVRALIETLDPFPFDTPSEEDFFSG